MVVVVVDVKTYDKVGVWVWGAAGAGCTCALEALEGAEFSEASGGKRRLFSVGASGPSSAPPRVHDAITWSQDIMRFEVASAWKREGMVEVSLHDACWLSTSMLS